MARALRFIQPWSVYHLISRFVAQEFFIETEEQRAYYLKLLGEHLPTSDWRCFSFAIMSNHVHLGVVAGSAPLASWLREMHSEFADWINLGRKRIGGVFVQHGPKAIEIDTEEEGRVARLIGYIHRNPVRAGVVTHPRDSNWTSHRAYVGLTQRPAWLDVDLGLRLAGIDPITLDALAGIGLFDSRDPRPRRGRPPKSREAAMS